MLLKYDDVKHPHPPVDAGTVIEYRVENLFGRPWAATCEGCFEAGMQRPKMGYVFTFD